ncbi:chemotaxis protein CheW [Methylobacter sp. S3L5C]|uniref:chemotaxis protein CheW n=1 Tax=Methylobacter sp. S3L5C TaxID=2839024 RepID=UPI001FAD7908|nr:chemotaxis protein CheW [Methylobacter sp. S3L5C]UOA10490.1 chemotaxis protein CheW [Methylobacter sp. S3L5C]
MSMDISQFSQIFFDEVEELLDDLERLVLTVDIEAPDSEDINSIFRIAHSIKGGAATFGFSDLIDITHELESMLDKIRHGELKFTSRHQEILLQSRDVLKMQIDGLRLNAPVDNIRVAEVRAMVVDAMIDKAALSLAHQISDVHDDKNLVVAGSGCAYAKRFQIDLPAMSRIDVEALTEELSLLGDLAVSSSNAEKTILDLWTNDGSPEILALCSFILDPDDVHVSEISADSGLSKAVNSVSQAQESEDSGFGFFDSPSLFVEPVQEDIVIAPGVSLPTPDQLPVKKKPVKADNVTAVAESSTVRVSIEKVDQLINLVGELVIAHAMITKRAESLDPAQYEMLLNGITQLGQNSRSLQESAMSMRMMPMDVVFSRFPRMVRELSGKLGKQITLETKGNSIELDKGLIEKIVDPLTHLIRNSIDHGIESPDIRAQSGKQRMGRLILSAAHQGGHVVIKVIDDGAGLNRRRILQKAGEQGLPVDDDISDEDVWKLIFAPGFSTAETVTDVSGRGVGMDVVNRNITSLGGTISIHSVAGLGTTTTVSLPLTLAILDGMSVKVGEETYILPLSNIVESFQPIATNVKEISGQGTVVYIRGEYLPIIPVFKVFTIEPIHRHPATGMLVVITADGRKAALLVDELVGQQQVVVKNIESNYRKVPNISGATIMADGSVSFIIDVNGLLREHHTKTGF